MISVKWNVGLSDSEPSVIYITNVYKRKRGALTRASLSIHHIMLTIKCYLSFKS